MAAEPHGRALARLRAKPRRYWLTRAAILLGVLAAKPLVDALLRLDDLKNFLFVHLAQSPTNPAVPHQVKLVAIGDDAWWGPVLAHRHPTNRAYLARLVRAADAADASVIALDFDLHADAPDQPIAPGDFAAIAPAERAEMDVLMHAIGEVASRRRIVLAKGMDGPDGGPYRLQSDIFQAYGLCMAPLAEGHWRNPGAPGFPLSPPRSATSPAAISRSWTMPGGCPRRHRWWARPCGWMPFRSRSRARAIPRR